MRVFLGLEDGPNPAYVFDKNELKILWNWIKYQHLPYDNLELKTLVSSIGDSVLIDEKK